MGRQVTTSVDTQGRPLEHQVGTLEPRSYQYDGHGRLTTVSQGSGVDARTSHITYGADGYTETVTDPLGHVSSLTHDEAGRLTSLALPNEQTIQYGYDGNGNLTSIRPPGKPAHTFAYSATNLQTAYTPPDVGAGDNQTLYDYDLDGQLTRITRPDGRTVDFTYGGGACSCARLSRIAIDRGEINYTYSNATGRLTGITAPDNVALSFEYDGMLPTAVSWAGPITGTVSGTYDNDFRVTSLSVNGEGAVVFDYDDDNLMTQAGALSLTHDAVNGLLTATAVGSVTDARGYNGFGETVSYGAAFDGTDFYSTQYTLDKAGRITGKTETVSGVTHTFDYTYDAIGRLTGVTKNAAPLSSYTYDGNGNRMAHSGPGGTVNGTYDDQDRLIQYGDTSYTYTANGERLTKTTGSGTTSYQYDELGNLMQATLPGGTQIDYVIDGYNRRMGKKVNGVLTQGFLYQNGFNIIAELDGPGNVISRFVYATRRNAPDYMIKNGAVYRMISDHLGSPRLVVDTQTSEIVQRMDYDEYGNVTADSNPGFQPFGFAGGLYDSHTKLTRFGARDYDPETGRWTAKDPSGFTSTPNLYTYAHNDPVNLADPAGALPQNVNQLTTEGIQEIEQVLGMGEGRLIEKIRAENLTPQDVIDLVPPEPVQPERPPTPPPRRVVPNRRNQLLTSGEVGRRGHRPLGRLARIGGGIGLALALSQAQDAWAADLSDPCGNYGNTKRFVGSTAGGILGGALAGAALGSVVPGAGTAVGFAVGAAGSIFGSMAGETLAGFF